VIVDRFRLCDSSGAQRAAYPTGAVAQHVGVDHGRGNVAVAQQFLHGADVVSALEEVAGEGVPEAVAGDSFVDPGGRAALVAARWTTGS
jgi:hypothetical protein